jgi:DNA-binding HxlR family transcriptional regulator
MHFNGIKRLNGISSNVLTKKLKQLEQEGPVTRRAVYENSQLRVEDKPTSLARELDAIFFGLDEWIAKWESRNKIYYVFTRFARTLVSFVLAREIINFQTYRTNNPECKELI